ncbi:MAG: FeoB-associated Cys-rich membrane protein [Opitutaceae bacterium]|nr:FeoB-associated Cys-rich membrane protein [Opitutaceae bacterium]
MSSDLQTITALVVVALTAAWFIRRAIVKRKNPGCGSDCGAVSPQMRKLQERLKQR